ncbi:MAG: hypothetical protein R3A44_27885 [Caldilineaceae bacterium]
MINLLLQIFIGGVIISTFIFYAALCIASRHEDAAEDSEAQLRSIRTVTPYANGQAHAVHTAATINATSVGASSISSTSMSST